MSASRNDVTLGPFILPGVRDHVSNRPSRTTWGASELTRGLDTWAIDPNWQRELEKDGEVGCLVCLRLV